jgi:imidazolonepropionase-like amidohydrolase
MDRATIDRLLERDIALDPTLFTYRNIAFGDAAPEYARENAKQVYDRHTEVFATAVESGVRILAGSDAGSPNLQHPSLHCELAHLVEFGLDPESALRAATETAARELGRPELYSRT